MNPIVNGRRWRGRFRWRVNGGGLHCQDNVLTVEGLSFLIALAAAPAIPTLYASLWKNNVTPTAAWTQATYNATAGEIGDPPEGYVEATRPAYDVVSAYDFTNAPALISNYRRSDGTFIPFTFNVRTATQLTVYGLALHSNGTKGGGAGSLISAARFTDAPLLFANNDIVDGIYDILAENL